MRRTTRSRWVLTLAASATAQDFPPGRYASSSPFPRSPLDISGRLDRKELQDRWGQRSSSRTSPAAPSPGVRREERAATLYADDHQLDPGSSRFRTCRRCLTTC